MDAQAMMHFGAGLSDLPGPVLRGAAWFVAGMLVGGCHFLSLRWNTRMMVSNRWTRLAIGVHLIRFAAIVALLAAITLSVGAFALLVTTLGLIVARNIILRAGAAA
jgi:F1F0 ATPase subunit 2